MIVLGKGKAVVEPDLDAVVAAHEEAEVSFSGGIEPAEGVDDALFSCAEERIDIHRELGE